MRNHYRPWFALPKDPFAPKKRIEPISDAWALKIDRGIVCNGAHCGCRTKPLDERIPGFIHGVIKSPLGR